MKHSIETLQHIVEELTGAKPECSEEEHYYEGINKPSTVTVFAEVTTVNGNKIMRAFSSHDRETSMKYALARIIKALLD